MAKSLEHGKEGPNSLNNLQRSQFGKEGSFPNTTTITVKNDQGEEVNLSVKPVVVMQEGITFTVFKPFGKNNSR